MLDPFLSACWGFILIPFVLLFGLYKIFTFFCKAIYAILCLTVLAIIATIIAWFAINH